MARRLRIATFNLESLDDPRPGEGPSLAERIEVLRPQLLRLQADVLCLQEINGQKPDHDAPRRLLALDRLLAHTPYRGFERIESVQRDGGGVLDVHNLVILSRFPVVARRQYWHDLVPPPDWRPVTAEPPARDREALTWDRPALHAILSIDDTADEHRLHVFNVHLRSPLAAPVRGQKISALSWRSVGGWAEGFWLAAIKRSGQAFETRLAVDRVFDDEPEALISVCGDFNADIREVPVRIVMGNEEDTGTEGLLPRALVPLEQTVPRRRRFSVMHDQREVMLDHLLVSARLAAWYRGAEIHNEGLEDEVRYARGHRDAPVSYHAPVVATFEPG